MNTDLYKNGWTFDRVIAQIQERNGFEECRDEKTELCLYRLEQDEKNTACVVGAFIPDALYTKNMERGNSNMLFKNFPMLLECMPFDADKMHEIQNIHDKFKYGGNSGLSLKDLIINKIKRWESA